MVFLLQILFNYCHKVLAVSNYCATPFKRLKNLDIVYNCINQTSFDFTPLPILRSSLKSKLLSYQYNESIFEVCCFSNHLKWKGIDKLIEAFNLLHKKSYLKLKLNLFGDGPYTNYLKRLASHNPSIIFHGRISNPLSFMSTMHLFILPSIAPESCPVSLIEAMSIGLPCVTTSIGGQLELIGDGGTLYQPFNHKELSNIISIFAQDTNKLLSCSEYCLERSNLFSNEAFASKILHYFNV